VPVTAVERDNRNTVAAGLVEVRNGLREHPSGTDGAALDAAGEYQLHRQTGVGGDLDCLADRLAVEVEIGVRQVEKVRGVHESRQVRLEGLPVPVDRVEGFEDAITAGDAEVEHRDLGFGDVGNTNPVGKRTRQRCGTGLRCRVIQHDQHTVVGCGGCAHRVSP
jgi:hypothetical protein